MERFLDQVARAEPKVFVLTGGEFDAFVHLLGESRPALWRVFQLVPTGRAKRDGLLAGEEMEQLFEQLCDLSLRVPYPVNTTEGQHYRRVALHHWLRNPTAPKPADALRCGVGHAAPRSAAARKVCASVTEIAGA